MFCGTLPGLMIIGSLKELATSRGIALAAITISALAAGNAAGRIIWGFICDRLRGGRAVYLSLGMIAGSVAMIMASGSHAAAFLAAAVLVGFCYGGNFAVYPARVAEVYGVQDLGTIYPLILFAHGLAAGVGPLVGGFSRDWFGVYEPALAIVLAVALLGLGLALVLRPAGPRDCVTAGP
jgi:OFA family oxalate/formate antiporter-like MFS transporter